MFTFLGDRITFVSEINRIYMEDNTGGPGGRAPGALCIRAKLRHFFEMCLRFAEIRVLSEVSTMKILELHCSVEVVKVGEKENTAAAAAAYISCSQIEGHDGRIHDYSKKPGFVGSGLLLPDGVPERWHVDPSTIWAEQDYLDYEKSTRRGPQAELYRSGNIGLPWEISYERAGELAEEILEPLREKGMVIQWAIHDTYENGKRNFHLHWMAAMREVTPDGFGKKNRAWNKYNGGLNIPDLLRPRVAEIFNRELEKLDSDLRVEHESFAARGIDRIPTKHVGPAATAMERKGVKTRKGRRNRYIEWLNHIHAENLRQVEAHTQSGNLDDVISGARAQQGGNEIFRDWDALFAMLRDTRRCRAALVSELGKLGKIVSAYEEGNEGYLRWAGCDPESDRQKAAVKAMQDDLRLKIKEMDVTEAFLLDSKELFKAHNKAVYAAKKEAWERYQADRNKRSIEYCMRRINSLERYISYLEYSLSLIDVLFETRNYKEYRQKKDELQRKRSELRDYRDIEATVAAAKVQALLDQGRRRRQELEEGDRV